MHFHIGDHLIFLIKTDNAHKERILLQTMINTFKNCEEGVDINRVKNDAGCQMIVVFILSEISCLVVSLLYGLVLPFSSLYL